MPGYIGRDAARYGLPPDWDQNRADEWLWNTTSFAPIASVDRIIQGLAQAAMNQRLATRPGRSRRKNYLEMPSNRTLTRAESAKRLRGPAQQFKINDRAHQYMLEQLFQEITGQPWPW